MTNTRHHFAHLLAAAMLAFGGAGAFAQSSARPVLPELPASAASAPRSTAPIGPRRRTAAETGNRAVAPGDLHPERPVTPQISIPFGKRQAPATKRVERVTQRGNPAASGGVDDGAARCEAQVDDTERASCRAGLAREAKVRSSN